MSGVGNVTFAVAALLALTAIAFVVVRPAVGLALLVFAIFTNASDVLIAHHGMPSLAKAYIPVIFVLIAYEWLRGRRHMQPPATALLVLLAYSALLALTLFYAANPGRVITGLDDVAKNVVLALAVAALASRADHFRLSLWGIVAGALWLGGLAALRTLTGSGSDFGGFAQAAVPYVYEGGVSDRLSGPLEDPNFFAQFMLVGVAVSFERALSEPRPALRALAAVAAVLAIVAVVLTYSRGGMIGLLAMTPFAVYRMRRQRRMAVLALILVVAALPALPPAYLDRVVSSLPAISISDEQSADASVRGRMGEMVVAWQMFLDHPVLGVGYNNYETFFQHYSLAHDQMPRGEARPAHSLYLEIAAERGIVGLLSFLTLIALVAGMAARGWREAVALGQPAAASMIAGLAVGFGAYLVAGIFLHDAFPRYFWLMIGLFLAVPGLVRNLGEGAQPQRGMP